MTDKVTVLDRRLYTYAEIDTVAGLNSGTVRRWLEGYTRRGVYFPPLLRSEPTGDELATWGEFVEVDLVARYRRRGISVIHLRPMVERLREEVGGRYPLAQARPLIYGRELIWRIQGEEQIPKALRIVMQLGNGQLVLAPLAEQFFESVEWEGSIARRIMPDGPESPVRIDPGFAFGRPTIRGIRTDRLAEAFRAGDSIELLARGYEIEEADVEAAIRYEANRAAVKAA